jgi:hypothetical protein
MQRVNCLICTDYLPDKINSPAGLGECMSYNAGSARTTDQNKIHAAQVARGNKPGYELFYPGLRDCSKYRGITNAIMISAGS